ncbi:MAG: ABC transporter ATP-binding protein [Candidatus Limnocylindrales bacterium]
MDDAPLAVEMRAIVKRFPGVVANDQVDFDLRAGEVHALLGENGAGKSTLMNILAGLYSADEGEIRVRGEAVSFASPSDAIHVGLGMVHQHFTLVDSLTVTENILLGLDEPRFRLDLPTYEAKVRSLAEKTGLNVDPAAKIWQLSVGEQQRVEILKMLYRGANILIMDEPTAVLAPQEIDELFGTLKGMTDAGASIVFISHKLDEVLHIADRVTVMRRGVVTAAGIPAAGKTKRDLSQLMVGREVLESVHRTDLPAGEIVLEMRGVSATSDRGIRCLNDVDLRIRSGQIIGLAGVAGNGQSELAEVITGLRACTGSIEVNGVELANRPVVEAIDAGVAHVPEDRTGTGSAPNLSLTDNLIMKSYRTAPIGSGWTIDSSTARVRAQELKEAYEVSAPSIDTEARLLSGGNLQRLILAREISSQPGLMVAVQPTRGLDVGAIETVHRLLLEQREAGMAVLLISEDLDEILMIADRVAVIYEGRISPSVPVEEAKIAQLGLMMTGTSAEAAAKEAAAQDAAR